MPRGFLWRQAYPKLFGVPAPDNDGQDNGQEVPPLVSPGYFGRVIRQCFGRDYKVYGGTFQAHFGKGRVTGHCITCTQLTQSIAASRSNQTAVALLRAKLKEHRARQFRERLKYREDMERSCAAFADLKDGRPTRTDARVSVRVPMLEAMRSFRFP